MPDNGDADLIVAASRWSAKDKNNAPLGGLATHEFRKQANSDLKIRLHTFN